MLLHNSNINVAIPVILLYQKSLYDLQRPKYKNPNLRMNKKWVRPILRGPPIELGLQLFLVNLNPQ